MPFDGFEVPEPEFNGIVMICMLFNEFYWFLMFSSILPLVKYSYDGSPGTPPPPALSVAPPPRVTDPSANTHGGGRCPFRRCVNWKRVFPLASFCPPSYYGVESVLL